MSIGWDSANSSFINGYMGVSIRYTHIIIMIILLIMKMMVFFFLLKISSATIGNWRLNNIFLLF